MIHLIPFFSLMRAALMLKRDRAIDVLISNWPWPNLSLKRLTSPVYDSTEILTNASHIRRQMHNAASDTTCLAHTFVENLKKTTNTQLQCLDISGYPACMYY